MSQKRTFGLVCDYGSGNSDDEDEEVDTKKTKTDEIDSPLKGVSEETDTNTNNTEETEVRNSKWAGVRQEYEDSSLMYKYVIDNEKSENEVGDKIDASSETPKDDTIDNGKSENEVGDKIDTSTETPKKDAQPTPIVESSKETVTTDPASMKAAMDNYYKVAYENSMQQIKEREKRDQIAVEWEIQEIQKEIGSERKRWEAVYSDDEGEGAETAEVVKDMARRKKNITEVVAEVTCKKKPEEDENLFQGKGERWKRLQMMSETRVKNNPEKYGGDFPNHKFPLRD